MFLTRTVSAEEFFLNEKVSLFLKILGYPQR